MFSIVNSYNFFPDMSDSRIVEVTDEEAEKFMNNDSKEKENSATQENEANEKVSEETKISPMGELTYSLWDVYALADLVTYPSLYEGFGNAFLEAVYHRKPLLVNRYDIFMRDIEPKGFETVTIDGYVTNFAAEQVQKLLSDPDRQKAITDKNYDLGKKYFSYDVLRNKLRMILNSIRGELA